MRGCTLLRGGFILLGSGGSSGTADVYVHLCRFIVTVVLLAPHFNLKMVVLSSEHEISLAGEHLVVNVGNWSHVS